MNQEQIKQQAREMAERCVNTAHSNPNNPKRQQWIDRILRELNLESLLEDKAIVDLLEQHAALDWPYGNKVDIRLLIITKEPFLKRPTLRQAVSAITNAMQEKESGE